MSRRHRAAKREILPDPKFHDLVLGKFMNVLMESGKKSVAESIVYGALDKVHRVMKLPANDNPLESFHKALGNVRPYLEVRSRRVGGATYQVPVDVRPERGVALAMRWLIKAARDRSEKTMIDRLAGELMDALNNRGGAIKKREDTHRMAEANKAFAHYRW
jgi:small subunit ribosomal protein S7